MVTRILDHKIMEALKDIAGDAGQKISRPSFHPFPARLPLSVAESLLRNISAPDAIILDPMAGSGTTIVAAKKLGREALGFDLDPLALLIARCAVHDHDTVSLQELKIRILDRAKSLAISNEAGIPSPPRSNYQPWLKQFARNRQAQIVPLRGWSFPV